ncbi:MAG: shikimate dehydrogenase [Candidatus Nanopelagicales bacterium]
MPRAAVLGSPISHSLSPALHTAAYRLLGIDWEYTIVECTKAQFPDFFAGLDEQWRGLSLTMPLKEVVLDVVPDVSDVARLVRSANTVFRAGSAQTWRATNTDISGIQNALREAGVATIDTARILGAGATARSAVAAIAGLGGRSVAIHARRREAAQETADVARAFGLLASVSDLQPVAGDCDLLVSTLPADIAAPWADVAGAEPATALLDASYHPWPTPLADAWTHCGAPVASGRDMLVWQAVEQVALMTGAEFDDAMAVAVMREALSTQ